MKAPSAGRFSWRGSIGAGPLRGAVLLLATLWGCTPTGPEKGSLPEGIEPCTEPYAEENGGQSSEEQDEKDGRAWENARQEKERLDMRAQMDTLTRSLARSLIEHDRSRHDRDHVPPPDEVRVREVDGRWGWVMLDGGVGEGLRREQVYEIYRGESWLARIRIADVRERVSGAWVEEVRSGWTPAPGDRAVREQRKR